MKLAINGGEKTRTNEFPKHPVITEKDKKAVLDVLNSGNISTFIASSGKNFLGGKKINELEEAFCDYFNVKYAVAMNSATSCLHAAIIACGIKAGDEVIVPPYTFTSTATCALMHNAIPVFVDVDPDTFCIDPVEVEKAITPKTKAIIPVHLFGYPAEMEQIKEIAKKHNLKVIEDCAQAPGGKYNDKLLGTMGDVGVFSLTESKTITSGEGGVAITNDEEIAKILQMVRNHGEMIIASEKRTYKSNFVGFCYRMTEMAAALGKSQFSRLDQLNQTRIELANYLYEQLKDIPGFVKPKILPQHKHVYYLMAFKYDEEKSGIPRKLFVEALNAEGIPTGAGYVAPLYLTPIYHENKPFTYNYFGEDIRYDKGICPITERLHEKELITFQFVRTPAAKEDMADVVKAIKKIIKNKEELLKKTR